MADAVHLPLGLDRPVEPDVGLAATVVDVAPEDGGRWSVDVSTRRFAQWVEFDVPGFEADDSWFHLAPGATRRVGLRRVGGDDPGTAAGPDGTIRAFNAVAAARVACEVAS